MDWEKRTLRTGAGILMLALTIKLLSLSPLGTSLQALDREDLVSAILFLQTGRIVKATQDQESEPTQQTLPAAATVISQPQLPLAFSQADLELLDINNLTGYSIDPERSLLTPLNWDLSQEGPAVLILHTHTTESYNNMNDYVETASYRTLDQEYNMVSIGAEVTRLLREGGVQVIHDTTVYDTPSYDDAYSLARQAVRQHLEQNPSIRLVLDIHRDAAQDAAGNQIAYTSDLGGDTAAQLMIVSGSDASGLAYPNWQENLNLAVQLQTAIQRRNPGICRPLSFRAQRYNQDLHPGMLLVEVGSAGNTHQQAVLAARALAQGVLDMAWGTVPENEPARKP